MTWKYYYLQYNISIYYVYKMELILKYPVTYHYIWLTFIKGNQITSQYFLEHLCFWDGHYILHAASIEPRSTQHKGALITKIWTT